MTTSAIGRAKIALDVHNMTETRGQSLMRRNSAPILAVRAQFVMKRCVMIAEMSHLISSAN